MARWPETNPFMLTVKCYLQVIHPLQYGYLNVTEDKRKVTLLGCIKYL